MTSRILERGFKEIEQRLGVKMTKAIHEVMLKTTSRRTGGGGIGTNNKTSSGLSESKDSKLMYESHKRRTQRGIASSFSPMSNRSRSNRKASILRSSMKKQAVHQNNEGSLLNMSNEVMMMRSLSPSIQHQDTRTHNQLGDSHHKRNSSLSPYR